MANKKPFTREMIESLAWDTVDRVEKERIVIRKASKRRRMHVVLDTVNAEWAMKYSKKIGSSFSRLINDMLEERRLKDEGKGGEGND